MRRAVALWAVAAVVFLTGWGVFLYRGLLPGSLVAADDFRVIYVSARAWLYGVNPYEAPRLDEVWSIAGGPAAERPSVRGSRDLLYPPPTFVLVAPVAAFDWREAREIWALVNFAAMGVAIVATVFLLGLRWRHPSTWIFAGVAIAFAPCLTGVKMGQTAMLLTALIASGHALRVRGHPWLGGVMLGLAAVLKPQIGLVFVAYEVFRWRWRSAGPALVVAAVVACVGIVRLEAAGVPWVGSLGDNVSAFTTGRGDGNPLPENPRRYQMIDLRPIMHNLTPNRTLALLGTIGFVGVIGLVALAPWLRRQEDERELIAISLGCALSLLIVYHRFYDASVLLLPLGWAVWALCTSEGARFGWTRWAVLAGILPFFVPGSAALFRMTERGSIPAWATSLPGWDTFVMHHQTWAIVWLCGALILALWRCPPRERPALAWLGRVSGERPREGSGRVPAADPPGSTG